MIFDPGEREDPSSQTHTESIFAFINRCSDPVFAAIRELLEAWIARYPSGKGDEYAQAELVARFRSGDDTDYHSAFWELYLHEVLTRLAYQLTPHPETPTGKRIDFLVTKGTDRFYLEAALVTSVGLTGQASIPGLSDVYDKINTGFDPDFWVKVISVVPGPTTPRRVALITPLERWLQGLDWETEWERYGEGSPPETVIEAGGWTVRYRAYPKSPEGRGNASFRMIGMYPSVGGISIAGESISDKLFEKAYRYGQLDAPYVIAIWSLALPAKSDDFQYALFGNWPMSDSDVSPGLWRRNAEPRATRVSAVLGAVTFTFGGEHSIAQTWPRLWLNPWADHPLEAQDLPWPTTFADLAESKLEETPGQPDSPATFFGLTDEWPGEPFAGTDS